MTGEKTYDILLDPDQLTLGELADVEEASGRTFDELLEEVKTGKFHTKTLIAFTWINERKHNPQFTLEDARAVKVTLIRSEGTSNGDPAPPNRASRRRATRPLA